MITESRWYAVQCQPHREQIAASHLTDQAFKVFLPCRERARRHARRIETVRRPFFPGYLFVSLDLAVARWRSINGTCGVVRLVAHGDHPSAAPSGVIEALMEACNEDGVLSWRPDLKPGQKVRILIGPFVDLIGELDRMTDAGRVAVLLDLLGGRTPVLLPREYIAPASSCV